MPDDPPWRDYAKSRLRPGMSYPVGRNAVQEALREAARAIGSWRVLDAVLYVTLEPCAMCAGAIVLARVPRVVFAATDPKAGAAGSVFDILAEPRLNHRPQVAAGLLAEESADLLRAFFATRRD
jgi:tRNA(adenine34) deaminase